MSSENVEWKCPKCGSTELRKKHVRLAGWAGDFNPLEAEACICGKCRYVELYED